MRRGAIGGLGAEEWHDLIYVQSITRLPCWDQTRTRQEQRGRPARWLYKSSRWERMLAWNKVGVRKVIFWSLEAVEFIDRLNIGCDWKGGNKDGPKAFGLRTCKSGIAIWPLGKIKECLKSCSTPFAHFWLELSVGLRSLIRISSDRIYKSIL